MHHGRVSKLFRAYELYNVTDTSVSEAYLVVSKLFRAYELYNNVKHADGFIKYQFQSSFELTSYITKHQSGL